jgi:urocanate hydratase
MATNPFKEVADHELWDTYRTYPDLIVCVDTDHGMRWVGIEKAGGGVVGEAYDGTWLYVVHNGTDTVASGADYHTGSPHTHLESVLEILDFLAYSDE